MSEIVTGVPFELRVCQCDPSSLLEFPGLNPGIVMPRTGPWSRCMVVLGRGGALTSRNSHLACLMHV